MLVLKRLDYCSRLQTEVQSLLLQISRRSRKQERWMAGLYAGRTQPLNRGKRGPVLSGRGKRGGNARLANPSGGLSGQAPVQRVTALSNRPFCVSTSYNLLSSQQSDFLSA